MRGASLTRFALFGVPGLGFDVSVLWLLVRFSALVQALTGIVRRDHRPRVLSRLK